MDSGIFEGASFEIRHSQKIIMEITKELIERVADNARLKLTDAEINSFAKELNDILDYFSKLNELKTDGVEPSFHPIELKNVMRDDDAKKSLSHKEVFLNTNHKKDNYFKGPKII